MILPWIATEKLLFFILTSCLIASRNEVFVTGSNASCKDYWPKYCKIINDSCRISPHWMRKYCPHTCGLCKQNTQVNPCQFKKCLYHSTCKTTGHSTRCLCQNLFDCPKQHSFVCGTDSVTYRNNCTLRAIACRLKKNIQVHSIGFCKFPCAHVKCRNFARCQIPSEGVGKCKCPSYEQCSRVPRPICGKNGVTYYNQCFWKVKSCKENVRIPILRRGRCAMPVLEHSRADGEPIRKFPSCAHIKCRNFARCHISSEGVEKCKCPSYEQCSRVPRPMCGKNGVTYYNQCFWKVKSCNKNVSFPISRRGRCAVPLIKRLRVNGQRKKQSCRSNVCPYYTLCREVNGLASCVKICPESSCPCVHDVEYYHHQNGCFMCRCKLSYLISARN